MTVIFYRRYGRVHPVNPPPLLQSRASGKPKGQLVCGDIGTILTQEVAIGTKYAQNAQEIRPSL